MASNRFNFQAKLGLETKDFKKGIKETKSLMTSLSADFRGFAASLMAGLSIGSLFDKMKESALQLSTAMNTLKNASSLNKDLFIDFGSNLEFVQNLSQKYGQNLLALTDSYAKFTGASYKTGLSLEKQQKIFESLVRAAAYYHLSADQTRDMMNAINQMMSKGKVAAEELRRQLGNNLPGAFNLMAAAIGVSTAELDKMMKDGKVISAEVLPQFATMLDKVTAGGNFDSLQASLNKFENAWLKFVQNSEFEKFYKGFVDKGTYALNTVADNVNGLKHAFIGLFGTFLANLIHKSSINAYNELDVTLKDIENRISKMGNNLRRMSLNGDEPFLNPIITESGKQYYAPTSSANERQLEAIAKHNKLLIESEKIRKKLGQTPLLTDAEMSQLEHLTNNILPSVNVQTKKINKFWRGLKIWVGDIAKLFGSLLKSFAGLALVSGVLAGISWAIEKIVDKLTETKRLLEEIGQISINYNNVIGETKISTDDDINQAKEYLKVLKNQNISLRGRQETLKKLSELTGNEGIKDIDVETIKEGSKAYEDLAAAVELWAKQMKNSVMTDTYIRQAAEAQTQIDNLNVEKQKYEGKQLTKKKAKITTTHGPEGVTPGIEMYDDLTKDGKAVAKINMQIEEYQKIINQCRENVEKSNQDFDKLLEEYYKGASTTETTDTPPSTTSLLDEIYKDYIQKSKELKRQVKEGAIDLDTYKKEFNKLNEKTFKDAAATGELQLVNLLKKDESTLTQLQKWYIKLSQLAAKSIADAFNEELKKSLDDAFKTYLDKEKENRDNQNKILSDIQDGKYTPTNKKRDKTFDYELTNAGVLAEDFYFAEDSVIELTDKVNILKEAIDEIVKNGFTPNAQITSYFNELNKQLVEATKNATNLEEAFKLAKISEDIKRMNAELSEGIWSNLTNFVSGIDSIVDAHERLNEVMDDTDASGWERFIATFNLLTSYVDMAINSIQGLNAVMEIAEMLQKAKNAQDAISLQNIATETGAIIANTTAKGANAAASTAAATASGVEAIASNANASAKAGEAVAGATASGAKLPFPYNLLAISAGVAAVIAALASLSKFAGGGFIPGNSTSGDHVLARVNSGELVLNKSQQSTLWGLLNGKGGLGGNVKFEIRGDKLIGVMNNTISKRKG
jgi:tape measure domain-containing protein